jgi:hypothetical protein
MFMNGELRDASDWLFRRDSPGWRQLVFASMVVLTNTGVIIADGSLGLKQALRALRMPMFLR